MKVVRIKKWYQGGMVVFLLIASGMLTREALAHESIFAWTYTTDLLPKGKWEIEHSTTGKWRKEAGTYQAIEHREEIEYGVTDNFQVSLYLNHHFAKAKNFMPVNDSANPGHRLSGSYETAGEAVHPGHDPSKSFETYHYAGFSTEFIYRLLSPYTNPVGLAFYMEPEIGPREVEVEWKAILQKNWLEDQLIWALNINYGLGYDKELDNVYERESHFEWFTGLSYRFFPKWSSGLELWNHHEFADAVKHEHSAFFLGPTLHYAAKDWWATVGFLHQLPIGEAYSSNNQEFAQHNGYIFGAEHEKYYLRLKMGVSF